MDGQVAAGMGHMLFLVKPYEKTDKLPVYEPEVEIEEGPAASEPAAPAGALNPKVGDGDQSQWRRQKKAQGQC